VEKLHKILKYMRHEISGMKTKLMALEGQRNVGAEISKQKIG
jgi:hypothetical protein